MNLTSDSFVGFKKDLIMKLKEFDKKYVKHGKQMHPILESMKNLAMEPIMNMIESSKHLLNQSLIKKKQQDFPLFRKMALIQKFADDLTGICHILKEYPNHKGNTLKQSYDIRHILDLLLIEGWEKEPVLKFYFDLMYTAYEELLNELRKIEK